MPRKTDRHSRSPGLKKLKLSPGKVAQTSESPHRRTFRIVSYPLLVVFNLLRFIVFQLWMLISHVYERVIVNKKYAMLDGCQTQSSGPSVHGEGAAMMGVTITPNSSGPGGTGDTSGQQQIVDPLLLKMKQHHRKAFQHLCKALKIDEEEMGKSILSHGSSFGFFAKHALLLYSIIQ